MELEKREDGLSWAWRARSMVLATLGEAGMGAEPNSEPEGLLRPEDVEASLLRSLWEVGVFGRFAGKEVTDSL